MHPEIETRIEAARGCGYRRPGYYLVADGLGQPCGKLPIPLECCPTCGGGIHPTRGWTWVDGVKLAGDVACKAKRCPRACPLRQPPSRVGLLWLGRKFYATPADWTREAMVRGVSRRIKAVPLGFELGKTWVWVAHRRAISTPCPSACGLDRLDCPTCDGEGVVWTRGVVHAFKPERVEVVVRGDEPDEEIERYLGRGFTPVRVIRDVDYSPLLGEELR